MKFKVQKTKFLEALKCVQNIVGGKGNLEIIQNVLIETEENGLKLVTTDLYISMMSRCECTVDERGATTIPVKYLFSAVSKLVEGEVEIYVDSNEKATITAANTKFRLQGMPASEFPKLPDAKESYVYRLSQQTMKEMLRKVSYASSQDDTRRALKGVLMSFKNSKLTMVATDGRRLALYEEEVEFPKDSEKDIVLPSKAVVELQRSLTGEGEIEISVDSTQVCFTLSSVKIYSKLIEETYPNYLQVVPKDTREHIEIDRQLLLDALERTSVMTIDENHATKLTFSSGKLTVSSTATDIGEAKDEVAIKYAGENIEVMFNPNYMMEPLKAIDEDEVTINMRDEHSPAIIKCDKPFIYVLMPLRTA